MADQGKLIAGHGARWMAHALLGLLLVVLLAATDSSAENPDGRPQPWYSSWNTEWGGHVKSTGKASWYDPQTLYRVNEDNPYLDAGLDFRLKNRLMFSDRFFVNTHYEAILSGGDTLQKENQLHNLPSRVNDPETAGRRVNDDRRLFNLTSTIHDGDNHELYHRLDRFQLSFQPAWGAVSIGRQALTWGNGLLFHPMDLFNPFSPTDIDRDYKMGDDMAVVSIATQRIGDVECLLVPRRDPVTGDLEQEEFSAAVKQHFAFDSTDFHIMLARHYGETIAGVGSTGYLLDAVWRTDVVWSSLGDMEGKNGYLSLVANLDYSWVWWGKNFYGLVEYYFNELGTDRYSEMYQDPEIMRRLDRGEIFVLGRSYLSGQVNLELHPLVSLYVTSITNLQDPSGILQAWLGWNIAQDIQLTLGGNYFYGAHETEFGGYSLASTDYQYKPSPCLFVWATAYF